MEERMILVREAVARCLRFFKPLKIWHSVDCDGNISVELRMTMVFPRGAELPSFVESLVNAEIGKYQSAREFAVSELFVDLLCADLTPDPSPERRGGGATVVASATVVAKEGSDGDSDVE